MNIYIGADHRGFELKKELIAWLKDQKYAVTDCGNTVHDPVDDYPDFGFAVGERVAHDMEGMGIVICGSGAGISVAANKILGTRCCIGFNNEQIKAMRNDDDINILALACNYVDMNQMKEFITTFIKTPYKKELRYDRRLQKIAEQEMMGGGCCGGGCGGC